MTVRILQGHLADMYDAILQGDFDRFAAYMSLPLQVKTRRAELWVDDLCMLEEGFDLYSDTLNAMGVDRFDQRAVSIHSKTNSSIQGRCASCWMCQRDVVLPVASTRITLEYQEQRWKASGICVASEDTRWPLMPHKR